MASAPRSASHGLPGRSEREASRAGSGRGRALVGRVEPAVRATACSRGAPLWFARALYVPDTTHEFGKARQLGMFSILEGVWTTERGYPPLERGLVGVVPNSRSACSPAIRVHSSASPRRGIAFIMFVPRQISTCPTIPQPNLAQSRTAGVPTFHPVRPLGWKFPSVY